MILSSYASCSWICFRAVISSIDSKIVALFNTNVFHSSMITSDALSWAETKSFEHEVFLVVKSSNSQLFFWLEVHSSTNYLLLVLIFAFLLDRIEMTWRIIIIVIFAFDKFELIETSAKIVKRIFLSMIFWSNHLNKSFASQNFCCRNEVIKISMILWSKLLVNLLHCKDHLDEK